MRSSEAINGISTAGRYVGDLLFGGIKDTYKNVAENNQQFGTAFKNAFEAGINDGDKLQIGKENPYFLSVHKTLGGMAGIGVGYRFLSGGGVYRDKNGDTDIAGIPFV